MEQTKNELLAVKAKLEELKIQLRETKLQLKRAEKSALLGKLISGLAHDVRSPLTVVGLSAQFNIDSIVFFSEKYYEWFSNFSRLELALFNHLIEYQYKNRHRVLSSRQDRVIRNQFLDYLEDHNYHSTFEAALLFTEMGYDEEPSEQIKACINEPMFLEVLQVASRMGNALLGSTRILSSVDFIDRLITALKSFIYEKEEGPTQVDIKSTIDTVITLFHHKLRNLDLIIENDEPILCYANFDELLKVWINNIENALYSMRDTAYPQLTIRVTVNKEEEQIVVEISDNGEGIDDKVKEKIFDDLFTTKPQGIGSGIGLSTVKKIIDDIGGKITLESEVEKGTSFYYHIPLLK